MLVTKCPLNLGSLCPLAMYLCQWAMYLCHTIGNSDVLTPSPTCYTAFQRLLGGKKGGPEVLLAIGFVEQDGKLVVTDLDVEWLKVASGELVVAAKRGPFY